MKKLIYKNGEIDKIILDESYISGFRWINNCDGHPTNLEIEIDWNGQQNLISDFDFMNIKTRNFFSSVFDAQFKFEFKDSYTTGALEISSFSYVRNSLIYSIDFKFNFAPIGYVKFNCHDFYFEIIENTSN